jgi:hypothetical protein
MGSVFDTAVSAFRAHVTYEFRHIHTSGQRMIKMRLRHEPQPPPLTWMQVPCLTHVLSHHLPHAELLLCSTDMCRILRYLFKLLLC